MYFGVADPWAYGINYVNFPGGTHGLIKTENGLLAEAARSNRIVDGLWPTVRDWLRARGFSAVS